MINVLIVDDSPTIREYLRYIISSDRDLKVVGIARDGMEAVEMVQQTHPDVVTMDIKMPRMDGYEATRKIMAIHPVPIIIISSQIPEQIESSFHAIKAGALAALEKPMGPGYPGAEKMAANIVRMVKLMSEVKVVTRFGRYTPPPKPEKPLISRQAEASSKQQIKLIAIGASTGGPLTIRIILSKLIKNYPLPILIVQHIASGFLKGMTDWLHKETGMPILIPCHGDIIQAGNIYFAPDDVHMGITKGGKIILSQSSPESGLRPSVGYLFRSVAYAYGKQAAGILLTGMGKDGAMELRQMRQRGAVTIAQDKESSIVHGMPGEAIRLDAATHILPPERIAAFLNWIGRG